MDSKMEELISSIYVNEANFRNIADSHKVNGTLLVELRRIMEEYGKLMYNQAIDDAIKYGQVRCSTNETSITASVYGTLNEGSFSVDKDTLLKLKK